MKKKLLKASLIACSILALASCGGNGSNNDVQQGDGDLVFDEDGSVVYKDVDLKLFSVTTGDDATTQDGIIKRFNELYEGLIHVDVEHISRYDLETSLQSIMEFDRESAPDIIFNHGHRTAEYKDKDWLLPLDIPFEKAGLVIDKEDYAESLINSTTVDGKTYGIPQDVHSAMITVRKDILEKNNLEIPTNYQEFMAVCDKAAELASQGKLYIRGQNSSEYPATEWRLATQNKPYYAFPFAYGDMWVHEFLGYTALVQNGGRAILNDEMPGWNSDNYLTGLELLKGMIYPTASSANKKPTTVDYGADYDVGITPFLTGDCIFKLNGPWVYQTDMSDFDGLLRADKGRENITTISLANLFAKDPTNPNAGKIKGEGHAIMMLSTVESMTKQCAAAVFADYMAYNSGIEWAKRGHIPALQSVSNSEEYKSAPEYEAYIKNWGTSNDYYVVEPSKYFSTIDASFKNILQKGISGTNKTPLDKLISDEYDDCLGYIELM